MKAVNPNYRARTCNAPRSNSSAPKQITGAYSKPRPGVTRVRCTQYLVIVAAIALFVCGWPTALTQSRYVAVTKYDPKRDAARDIDDAVAEATRTNRRILLEVGGDWCIWCHHMDDFFAAHPDLTTLRDKKFITVKINFSDENKNSAVINRYAPIPGYPHLYVLNKDGSLLHSQDTSALEEGKSYNLEKFTTFLAYWAWAKEK